MKPGDVRLLAEAIKILLTDGSLRSKLSENAYKYAQSLSWDGTAEATVKILNNLLTSP